MQYAEWHSNYYYQTFIYICRHSEELKNEAKAHVLNHVNIVTLYAMIFELLHYGLVLEFVPLGCLEEFIFRYQVLFASVKNVIFMIYAKLLVYDYVLLWPNNSLSILTAIFPGEPGLAGFIRAADDGPGGDNWSCKTCKASVKSSPSTNQHQMFSQARCPSCHPTNSVRALKAKVWYSVHLLTCLIIGKI